MREKDRGREGEMKGERGEVEVKRENETDRQR